MKASIQCENGTSPGNGAVRIRPMASTDAPEVARHHAENLPEAFLSRLGVAFLSRLYATLLSDRSTFVWVAEDPEARVVGFVCGTTNVRKMYRSVLWRRGWLHAGMLLPHLLRPKVIRWVVEKLRYPFARTDPAVEAELLAIVVAAVARGSGVADDLLDALAAELERRGCRRFRVVVGAALDRSNAFYVRRGFTRSGEIESHGQRHHVYTIETARLLRRAARER